MGRRGAAFYAQLAVTLAVCAVLAAPVAVAIAAGLTAEEAGGQEAGLTLRWVEEVWRLHQEEIVRSMAIAVACLAVDLAVGVPAAYALARRRTWPARLVKEALLLPAAVPGVALAMALLLAYGGDLRTSGTLILAGHVLFTLPFMVTAVMAVLTSAEQRELDETARSLGAGFWQRVSGVVLPNAAGGIVAGGLTVVALSIGEFNLTWLLHTPATRTLPVVLAGHYASARLEIAGAATLVLCAMVVPLFLAAHVASRVMVARPPLEAGGLEDWR